MPELPEVQTTVDGINSRAKGLVISDAWTDYGGTIHAGKDNIKDPRFFIAFRKSVVGARIDKAERRGKNILINLSNGKTILIHMKMTGHMMHGAYKKLAKKDAQGESWRPSEPADVALNDPFNRFIHFVLSFSDGTSLVLSDMRKFAKVTLVDTATIHESEHLRHHGPEPLDASFDSDALIRAVSRKPNGAIKTVLMDNTVISGIGNIYSDEVLWRVGINPLERIKNVSGAQWKLVLKAVRETLRSGIDFGGDSMSDYRNIDGLRGAFQERHNAYRKTGSACVKKGCKGTVIRLKVGGRSAHFCSIHQKLLKARP
ncbi:MAG: bifunctional DNA-formamidopyrimidine glycosylase/DNA-(apurinic or apyrimidinic site) lyase [Candidatus Paceibacterota bacterium]|jgi:formamidopyrimidine-DNA glycosylase